MNKAGPKGLPDVADVQILEVLEKVTVGHPEPAVMKRLGVQLPTDGICKYCDQTQEKGRRT